MGTSDFSRAAHRPQDPFIDTSPEWTPPWAPAASDPDDSTDGEILVVAGPAELVEIVARRKCREPIIRLVCVQTGEELKIRRPRGRRARTWLLSQLRRLVGRTLTDRCPCGCGNGIYFGVAEE